MSETIKYVVKRDGRQEAPMLDKIQARIRKLCFDLDMDYVDPVSIAGKVISGLYNGITTSEMDDLAAETCYLRATYHPDNALLGGRIRASNTMKSTSPTFSGAMEMLYEYVETRTQKHSPIISKDLYDFVMANADELNTLAESQKHM